MTDNKKGRGGDKKDIDKKGIKSATDHETEFSVDRESNSRRKLLKSITATGGVVTVASLPTNWKKPLVDSIMLPAHAQTSVVTTVPPNGTTTVPPNGTTTRPPNGTTTVPPCTVSCSLTVSRDSDGADGDAMSFVDPGGVYMSGLADKVTFSEIQFMVTPASPDVTCPTDVELTCIAFGDGECPDTEPFASNGHSATAAINPTDGIAAFDPLNYDFFRGGDSQGGQSDPITDASGMGADSGQNDSGIDPQLTDSDTFADHTGMDDGLTFSLQPKQGDTPVGEPCIIAVSMMEDIPPA